MKMTYNLPKLPLKCFHLEYQTQLDLALPVNFIYKVVMTSLRDTIQQEVQCIHCVSSCYYKKLHHFPLMKREFLQEVYINEVARGVQNVTLG